MDTVPDEGTGSSPKPRDTKPQSPVTEGMCRTWDSTFSINPFQRHHREQILAPHPEQRPLRASNPADIPAVGYSHCIHPEIQTGFKKTSTKSGCGGGNQRCHPAEEPRARLIGKARGRAWQWNHHSLGKEKPTSQTHKLQLGLAWTLHQGME